MFHSGDAIGPYYYLGYSSGTTYTHIGAVSYAGGMYYQAVALTGGTALLETIAPGETMEAVTQKMLEY